MDNEKDCDLAQVLIGREHRFKGKGRRLRGNLSNTFFTEKAVGTWNLLLVVEVEAGAQCFSSI